MTMHPRRVAALVCVFAAMTPATTLPRGTTRDLLHGSQIVICAACESCEARLDPRSGVVFTHVRVRLLESLKGGEGVSTIDLTFAGGQAQGVKTVVSGMPAFVRGQESVLFLKRIKERWIVSLGARGHIPIMKEKSGRRRLTRPVTGLKRARGLNGPLLEDFRSAVSQELRAKAEADRAKKAGK